MSPNTLVPPDIIAKVRRDFSEDEAIIILQLLSQFQKNNPELEDRILRCIVFLAAGSFDKFAAAIRQAQIDWRDLISAAEYNWEGRARLLSLPFDAYPDVETIKNWLYHKTFLIPWSADNAKWTIQRGEIRELSIENIYFTIPEAPADAQLPFALISFLLIRGDREISASNAMEGKACVHYVVEDAAPGFEFKKVSTRPEWLKKRGKW